MTERGFAANVSKALAAAATAHGVPVNLLRAIAYVESRGNPLAVGPATRTGEQAKGLMQLMAAVQKDYGVTDPFDPAQSANAGAAFIAKLITKFGGDVGLALAGYNWGPRRVETAVREHSALPAQVQRYVERVNARWRIEDGGEVAAVPLCSRSCPLHCGGQKSGEHGEHA